MVPARPFFIGSDGWVRSSAWIWDFSSTHSTTALSGGFRYSPTTSMSFFSNRRSFDSLKVSTRCGLQIPRCPDTLHGRRADSLRLGHRPARPVRLARWLRVQGGLHNGLDLLHRDRRLAAPPSANYAEVLQSLLTKAPPPRGHARR